MGSNKLSCKEHTIESKKTKKNIKEKDKTKKEYKRCKNIGCTVHAETDVIKKALSKNVCLKGTSIYVSRVTVNGDMAMAKPCSECIIIIKMVGIKNIYYTTETGWKHEKSKTITGVPSSGIANLL